MKPKTFGHIILNQISDRNSLQILNMEYFKNLIIEFPQFAQNLATDTLNKKSEVFF